MIGKLIGCRHGLLITDTGAEIPVTMDYIDPGFHESTRFNCIEIQGRVAHDLIHRMRDVYRHKLCIPRMSFEPLIPKNPNIKKVIHNDPATIVLWDDGTKTVVKCQPGDEYNAELGLAMCISKKYFGNKGNFNEVFKKWIPEEKRNRDF